MSRIASIPELPPCPMGDAIERLGIDSATIVHTPDQEKGVALIEKQGAFGLLRWDRADAHQGDIASQIQWGRLYELLPLAKDAERAMGLDGDYPDTISADLHGRLRATN